MSTKFGMISVRDVVLASTELEGNVKLLAASEGVLDDKHHVLRSYHYDPAPLDSGYLRVLSPPDQEAFEKLLKQLRAKEEARKQRVANAERIAAKQRSEATARLREMLDRSFALFIPSPPPLLAELLYILLVA